MEIVAPKIKPDVPVEVLRKLLGEKAKKRRELKQFIKDYYDEPIPFTVSK